MGKVLFVRDPSGLQEHVDQLKHEKEQALSASEKLKNQLLESDKQKEDLKQRQKKIEEEIFRSEAQMELLKNILEGEFGK